VSVTPDINDGFLGAVSRHSDRPALVHNGQSFNYKQLHALVSAAALSLGPYPGVVGIPSAHTPETIIGLLATWAAGGTYCPVDPTFPRERRKAMMAAAECRTMFAPQFAVPAPDEAVPEDLETNHRHDAEQPAYILFTSGTTGSPKPVVTPRRAIATVVRSLHDLFGITPDDRVLQFASLNWDTCFEEILPTLTAGATLVLNDEAHTGSFPRFLRMLEHERITVLNLPTAYWHELVHHLTETGTRLPGSVRTVVIGGEPVNPARLADWCGQDKDPGTGQIRLINTYGCTETTLISHAVDLHGPLAPRFDWRETERAPIGWPLPHVLEHVSDQGELLIGGPALALGYRGLPESTEARFVDLETATGRTRFFRTGDRVRRSPDGTLFPAGRLDHEVKVRGIRVDPGEVESHLASHPAVNAVAVVGATVAGRTALLAYVVPGPHARLDNLDADIRAYLSARVPPHLVPSRITVVPELVHTASGKVDRAATHQQHTAQRQPR
jgi:nonribosomal peptide synthetase protein VioO